MGHGKYHQVARGLVWPVTVLILIFYFRELLKELFQIVSSRLTKARSVTAKMGGFELSLQQIEELQKRVENIANAPDAEKRLCMARDPLLVDDILKRINPEDVKCLEHYYLTRLRDAFIVNWYQVSDQDRKILMKLEKEGLIAEWEMYGASIENITPLGVLFLTRLGIYKAHDSDESKKPNV